MKEEDAIFKKVGKENAFKVPQGYFENLTSEVMNKLPEVEQPVFVNKEQSKWQKMKPLLYMAAMFIGAALIIKVASIELDRSNSTLEGVEFSSIENVSDQYISEAVNGTMMDDYSLYLYLSDTNAE